MAELRQPVYPIKFASHFPVTVFQIRAVSSLDTDTICIPSGEKTAEITLFECLFNSASHTHVAVFQILAVLSSDAETICMPSEENSRVDMV